MEMRHEQQKPSDGVAEQRTSNESRQANPQIVLDGNGGGSEKDEKKGKPVDPMQYPGCGRCRREVARD